MPGLPLPLRAVLALAIVIGAAALIVVGFRVGIVGAGPFGWFWVALIVAISATNLYSYVLRGRPPWPGRRRARTPRR